MRMDWLSDPVVLARIQFALTALFHYIFVPVSIGVGLVTAVFATRSYKSGEPADEAITRFWVRLYTITFAIGVATGITMEFQFGTNWADYSRFVGDIFGAPLAAEALFAFFMESVFIGILIFGRHKVSRRLYMVSAWLAWAGSCLSALWIIIANSWMQTPAGFTVTPGYEGSKATITDFFAAALNPSTLPRYFHVLAAVLITGSLVCIAVGAYYLLKGRAQQMARDILKVGVIMGAVTAVVMLPAAHLQASTVAKTQPAKLAAMEGQYETAPVELSLLGWVDEANQQTYALSIPGGTSFLADGNFTTEYPGLNDFAEDERPEFVNFIFQSYHLMVALFGLILVVVILGALVLKGVWAKHKWPLVILSLGWLAPLLAIEFGWMVTEFGRQPWIVYGVLKVSDAVSLAVPAGQVLATIALFIVVYTLLFVCWARLIGKTLKHGPEPYLAAMTDAGANVSASDDAPSYFGADAAATAAADKGADAAAGDVAAKKGGASA